MSGAGTLAARIRADIERHILQGDWPPGHRIPFEQDLATDYGCSRMTVNKVLSALAAAGLIVRRRRAGSFVAVPRVERALMAIGDFAEEARRLGVQYRHEILYRDTTTLEGEQALAAGLAGGSEVLRIGCRHHLGDAVIACEQRIISLSAVPRAREETFETVPPGTWLLQSVPWTQAEHVIRACNADAELVRLLGIAPGAACLVMDRRTWQQGAVVTDVRITYPGDRHRFVGRFSPTGGGNSL
jgi:GntR family transcriptional regulator, histidine utilization repressor